MHRLDPTAGHVKNDCKPTELLYPITESKRSLCHCLSIQTQRASHSVFVSGEWSRVATIGSGPIVAAYAYLELIHTQSFVAVRAQCRDDGCAVSWMAAWGMDSHLTHAVQPPHNQKVIHGLHIAIDQQLDHVVHTQWCLRTLWSLVTDASRRCYSLLDDAARIAAAHCTHPRWMANSSGVMPSLSALSTSAPALISAAATSAMPACAAERSGV